MLFLSVYGPIPKGSCIVFLDRNRDNLSIENLKLVPKKVMGAVNSRGPIPGGNTDLNKINYTLTELEFKYKELTKERK